MTLLFCDIETYSPTPINCGTHRYAEQSEVMLWPYAIDDGPVEVWDVTSGKAMPSDLKAALNDRSVMTVWHNGGMFDTVVLLHAMGIDLPLERVHDTMVQALSHSLPGSLGDLCDILGVDTDKAKDKDGRQLIHLFCKPIPFKHSLVREDFSTKAAFDKAVAQLKAEWNGRATRETHPERWAKFVEYARLDVDAMREVYRKLPVWNYRGEELALWQLDQTINRRGVAVDLDLVDAAVTAVAREQQDLARRTVDLTDGAVQAATQRDAMLAHLLAEYGVELPDMQKSTLERRINDPDLPEAMRELLAIRLQASTTSTSKYKTLGKAVSSDGRLRGTLQFNGASRTGRWAGRLFQPQNLPRPSLKQPVIDAGIEALKAGCADLITDNVMELTSSAIRGCIIAPPGKKLVVADLSNIEGRVLAWLAGEQWKLAAFRAFDALKGADGRWIFGPDQTRATLEGRTLELARDEKGKPIRKGHDLYKLAYAKSFSVEPDDVDDDQRQVGKVQELALGYEGGVGAFLTFAAVYGIDLEAMAEQAIGTLPADILAEARDMLAWTKKQKRPTFGLTDQAWIVCESFKRSWRYAHPAVASFWKELAEAVRKAIGARGVTMEVRSLKIRRDGNWLRIRLPSGRYLCYPSPQVADDGQISYMGINQYSRKWSRLKTYGGKLAENITQAAARDVMASAMPHIEEAGYEIILTVHDEIITEAPDSAEFSHGRLAALMASNPDWSQGLPLAAAGFEAYRYRKD